MAPMSQRKSPTAGVTADAKIWQMKKDSRLTLRIQSGLKKNLQEIADREGHSVALICEAFLLAGSEAYKKQGTKLVQRLLVRLITQDSSR